MASKASEHSAPAIDTLQHIPDEDDQVADDQLDDQAAPRSTLSPGEIELREIEKEIANEDVGVKHSRNDSEPPKASRGEAIQGEGGKMNIPRTRSKPAVTPHNDDDIINHVESEEEDVEESENIAPSKERQDDAPREDDSPKVRTLDSTDNERIDQNLQKYGIAAMANKIVSLLDHSVELAETFHHFLGQAFIIKPEDNRTVDAAQKKIKQGLKRNMVSFEENENEDEDGVVVEAKKRKTAPKKAAAKKYVAKTKPAANAKKWSKGKKMEDDC
jgi:hypothetical protein